jgi:hypothetical protein
LSLRKEILITIALSGWSIGLTVVAAGGELLGLARELIHAGAETSLLNLLDVQDQSAAQLMTSFYPLGLQQNKDGHLATGHAAGEVRVSPSVPLGAIHPGGQGSR